MTPRAFPAVFPSIALASLVAAAPACSSRGASSATPTADDGGAPDAQDAPDAPPRACAVPAARLGDAPEARALAASPAKCGQAQYAWRSDASLGSVTKTGAHQTYISQAMGVLAAAGKITPRAPLADVTLDQIAYTTQDRGALLDATALVAYPTGDNAPPSADVLLVLHGTSGFTDQCAPSLDPTTRELVATFASLGYVVVAPDYIGMNGLGEKSGFLHPYLVGQPTAIASLDAVRAAVRFVATKGDAPCARPRYATVGGSQGGLAALWVDLLAPYYAPELELAGVVATVPPADLMGESVRALGSMVNASSNVAAFFAASSDWYGTRARLGEVFVSPIDTALPSAMASSCDPSSALGAPKPTALSQVFQQPLLDAAASATSLAALSPWGCLVTENGATTTSIARITPPKDSYGILWVNGEDDQLVTTPIERDAFATMCNRGIAMQFLECAGAGHVETTKWSLPEILDFVGDRFAGVKMVAACAPGGPVRCRGTP